MEQAKKETVDWRSVAERHPWHERAQTIPPDLKQWVDRIAGYVTLQDGGYVFRQDDLTFREWRAIALMRRTKQEKTSGD